MADVLYDLCIVGAGLIGTAAARHASLRQGTKVCLIGPNEPESKTLDRDIYGAHYDEGRIARSCLHDPIWNKLAGNSIQRFRALERDSGIKFFNETGNLVTGTDKSPYIGKVKQLVRDMNLNHTLLPASEAKSLFPYLKFPPGTVYIYQQENSGNISPRRLVEAQKTMAIRQGCTVYDDVVSRIRRRVDSTGCYVMDVETEAGRTISCKDVLVATGAFTAFRHLLPGIQLDLDLDPETVALVEINKTVAERLRNMPCVRFTGGGHADWFTDSVTAPEGVHAYYLLPPIVYPDGRYYIKLGLMHHHVKPYLSSLEEVKTWYVNGDIELAGKIKRLLLSLFKGLEIESWHSDYCVIVSNPTGLPYIDKIHGQLGVATAANGLGAMSGDEIGRLAVDMMFDQWTSDIPRDAFKVKYKPQQQSNL